MSATAADVVAYWSGTCGHSAIECLAWLLNDPESIQAGGYIRYVNTPLDLPGEI